MAISKSKAAKPLKVVKPAKKTRRTTESHRNHRFQPFSERISKLKIDPIRKRRDVGGNEELSEETATYFGRSLAEWQDLNLTVTFTAFARQATPLCDSLPMVLHNDDEIMDLLVTYIEKGDSLAMEPLLSLLSHFAHDLDTRFEKHFQRAVSTVAAVAAKHPDPAVIEWSFTCLAWLFKYLQRLLVSDLRPLYDLMSPYLGKVQQKPFVIRFAAESLSYLVKKAAVSYERDSRPLDGVIGHMLEDCRNAQDSRSYDLYRQGVMTLLTEAIKGVQHGVHSSGLAVLKSLLKHFRQLADQRDNDSSIAIGILTSIIHFTTPESFQSILELVFEEARVNEQVDNHALKFASDLLLTVSAVRKGSRVSEWSPVVTAVCSLIDTASESPDIKTKTRSKLLATLAIVLQNATIDAVLPNLGVLDTICSGAWAQHFMQFCDSYSRLCHERFVSFVLPRLRKFVLAQKEQIMDALLLYLPQIASRGQPIQLQCDDVLQRALVDRVDALTRRSDDGRHQHHKLDLGSAYAVLAVVPYLKLRPPYSQCLVEALQSILRTALDVSADSGNTAYFRFGLGTALASLLELGPEKLGPFRPDLCYASARVLPQITFWRNLRQYVQLLSPSSLDGEHMETLKESLVKCLSMPSHDIRECALDIMLKLYEGRGHEMPSALATAALIESTPIKLDTSRAISMNIRRLSAGYAEAESDSLLQKAIPAYCFGLLHIRLSQAWDDAVQTLADIAKSLTGEEAVISLAQSWLESSPDAPEDIEVRSVLDADSQGFQVASDFECSNFAKVSAICTQVFDEPHSGYSSAQERLRIDHQPSTTITPNSRNQALKVLSKIPHLAEKRSRMLVPVLLKWAGEANDNDENPSSGRWSRKDQKAMLAIFAQFSNPRVLYKSAEVYYALLNLCANGDVEIQRSSLKALLTWKQPAITRYEEHLNNLLDDARFREEVSVFLQGDDEDAIQPDDQPELIPLLLRLLYGRAVGGGKEDQQAKRKAIFVALSRFGHETLGLFVDIVLSSAVGIDVLKADSRSEALARFHMPLRQQVGMLNMLSNMLDTLGPAMEPYAVKVTDAVLLCAVKASRIIENQGDQEPQNLSMLKTIRQTGLQCLVELTSSTSTQDESTAEAVIDELIAPRLARFATENTQSVSGLLRLISAWSQHRPHCLTLSGGNLLTQVAVLLREPNTKDEVRLYILQEILDHLEETEALGSHVSGFVHSISELLCGSSGHLSRDVLATCVSSLSWLAGYVSDSQTAQQLILACSELLKQPGRLVLPSTKVDLLRTIIPLLNLVSSHDDGLYGAVCGLFSRMSGMENRHLLSQAVAKFAEIDSTLEEVAVICDDLNAHEGLDQPDHERRARGFNNMFVRVVDNDGWTSKQWLAFVQNSLFFIKDDDMVTRSNASRALDLYIHSESDVNNVSRILVPAVEYGMRQPSELVRAEYVRLLGQLVRRFPQWSEISDLQGLTTNGDDDDASFFNDILHIQQYQRIGALKRLSNDGKVSSRNVSRFLLPLLEHFIFDQAEGDSARTLADQTISAIGMLTKSLKWSDYRATLKRYYSYLKSKPDLEKTVLRLIGALIDGLATWSQNATSSDPKRVTVVEKEFLPPLTDYLHHREESTVDRRVAVAISIVKLLRALPESEFTLRLAPVLTDVCQILRSRDTEARDQTRKTLATICTLIGPSYFGFVVKELRGALQRGYQLHVLSFTIHSLLVTCSDLFVPGDLNDSLPDLTTIIMDDTFGVTGQEKDAEEYKSGMKEVKSSKSFDTMELLAARTPVTKLGELIKPLRSMLQERLDSKSVLKIDELLHRVRRGIDKNPEAKNGRELLVFCHEIVRQVYAVRATSAPTFDSAGRDYRLRKYLIQMKASNKSSVSATGSHMFKLAVFALNLVRLAVRHREDLRTPTNMAGFLPMIGDALVESKREDEVKLAAVKLLNSIVRMPLADLDANSPVYLKEAIAMVKSAPDMTATSAKAALELITTILQHKQNVTVNEKDVAFLLKALKPDLDEPDRQGIIHKFLRAVLGRKIVITEVYEVMDEVAKMMITNPDNQVRQNARSAYMHFLLEFPQGKDRWTKQTAFIVKNLDYEHTAGRRSVMELVLQLLSKLDQDVVQQILFTLFVGLVSRLVSDPDSTCRESAGLLIGKILERADGERLKTMLDPMRKWLGRDKRPALRKAALMCWTIYSRTQVEGEMTLRMTVKESHFLLDELTDMISTDVEPEADSECQLLNTALELLIALCETFPAQAFSESNAPLWSRTIHRLGFPHQNVKLSTAILTSMLLNNVASAASNTDDGLAKVPLKASGGLFVDADLMRRMSVLSLRMIETASGATDQQLLSHTARNSVMLGRFFAANAIPWREQVEDFVDSDDEDTEADLKPKKQSNALGFLLDRLSSVVRRENAHIVARTTALQTEAALIHQLDYTTMVSSLHTILRPLHSLTDRSIPLPPGERYQNLSDKARELMDTLQKKDGTERFQRVLGQVSKEARGRRDERRQKRRIEAVSAPEQWAREKRKKYEVKKARQKVKGAEARGQRRGW